MDLYFSMVFMAVKHGWFYILNYFFIMQVMGRNQTTLAGGNCFQSVNSGPRQDSSGIREKYESKLEQVLFCFRACNSYHLVWFLLVS